MKLWYARRMDRWEKRLAFRATNRVLRDFEWGLEWTRKWPCTQRVKDTGAEPEELVRELNRIAAQNSETFFAYQTPQDYKLSENILRFRSAVESPYPENNIVHAQWFPARQGKNRPPSKRAAIVLPHWNAPAHAHNALCRGLAFFGISALRISLPYHDYRMPAELQRADYAVSSNICRTIDATRQAVIDVRSCADWLEQQGYEKLGIVGTSLGSCYAYLTTSHDPRIRVNVFNHCSTYFADVVWTGLSTQHIRRGLEQHLDLERLRQVWHVISPVNYLQRFVSAKKKSLFIYASYDTTFLPEFSRQVIDVMQAHEVDHKAVVLPCGHYTLGETPFKFIDGYHICSFLAHNL